MQVRTVADIVNRNTRSRIMAAVRSSDTSPELAIRKALHARGFRYRTNVRELPGKPDIVLPKYRAAIFVHGCFWHAHDCALFRLPATRRGFWKDKLERNQKRDEEVGNSLNEAGWRFLTVWECAIRGPERRTLVTVIDEVISWLEEGQSSSEVRGDAPTA